MPSVLRARRGLKSKKKGKKKKKKKRQKHHKVKTRRTEKYKGKTYFQTGESDYSKDVKRRARRPSSHRISKSGKKYSEHRRNRSDMPTRRV